MVFVSFCDMNVRIMNFTAIDFETATGAPNSACAVAIITVENSIITEQYETLIQPPENKYWYRFTKDIHGISWRDTSGKPDFAELYPEIKTRLQGRLLVAHNARFDRNVLQKTMEHHGLNSSDLEIAGWDCTLEIYQAKGFKPANLAACCERLNIELNHHEALSDALACAKLYLLHHNA